MRNTYFNIGIYFDKPNNTSLTVVKWPRYTLNITLPDMQTRSILLAQRIVHQSCATDQYMKSIHNTNIGHFVQNLHRWPKISPFVTAGNATTNATDHQHSSVPSHDDPTAWVWPPPTSIYVYLQYSKTKPPGYAVQTVWVSSSLFRTHIFAKVIYCIRDWPVNRLIWVSKSDVHTYDIQSREGHIDQ